MATDKDNQNDKPTVKESEIKREPAQERKDVVHADQGPQEGRDARQNQTAQVDQTADTHTMQEKAREEGRSPVGAEISGSDNVVTSDKKDEDKDTRTDAEKQSEELHKIDQHTGEGTAFPEGSPMAVVPPSNKAVI